ncbi:MAG: diguanylate cyclase domain-containing protein [Anaerovoracaceae bacterium]|jgi:diguanylate cyclase (GGDEF)-like protein
MSSSPLWLSLLFFTVFGVYFFCGIYIIYLNPKALLNRLFLSFCISLAIWSLGLSIAFSAPEQEAYHFWHKISALGWSSLYGILLHLTLVITQNHKKFIFKNINFIILLYVPAGITFYIVAISGNAAPTYYELIPIYNLWNNILNQKSWIVLYQLHYVFYVITCLLLMHRWKKQNPLDKMVRKQANLALFSILSAIILNIGFNFISKNLNNPPQICHIVALIPTFALLLLIKCHHFKGKTPEGCEELVLDDETMKKLHNYLGIAFLSGGVFTSLSHFFPFLNKCDTNLDSMLIAGSIFFLLGIIIYFSQFILNLAVRKLIFLVVPLFSIPIITLIFLDHASITVWMFPVVLIVISMLFNNKLPLILITSIAIITQIIVWIYAPKGAIHMDEFDYAIRIGIFLLILWIGIKINTIYMKKLNENIYQMDYQRMVMEITYDFLNVTQSTMDDKINSLLSRMGAFFNVDRTFVFLFDSQNNTMNYTHEWCNENISRMIDASPYFDIDSFPWLTKNLVENKFVCIEDPHELAYMALEEDVQLIHHDGKSMFAVPIEEKEQMLGFIGLITVKSTKRWSDYHIKMLRILANILADVFIKIRAEKEIERMAFYDHLTGLPNRSLFSERLQQAIARARDTESHIGIIFIDLDSFKMVNDTMGHGAGDSILKAVSKGLASRLRSTDMITRFGGDEFLVLIDAISNPKDAEVVAEYIMELFDAPYTIGDCQFTISASAGIAIYPTNGKTPETLIKNADMAMYMAKSKGKNQYVIFDNSKTLN